MSIDYEREAASLLNRFTLQDQGARASAVKIENPRNCVILIGQPSAQASRMRSLSAPHSQFRGYAA